jgi:hypothetical protein
MESLLGLLYLALLTVLLVLFVRRLRAEWRTEPDADTPAPVQSAAPRRRVSPGVRTGTARTRVWRGPDRLLIEGVGEDDLRRLCREVDAPHRFTYALARHQTRLPELDAFLPVFQDAYLGNKRRAAGSQASDRSAGQMHDIQRRSANKVRLSALRMAQPPGVRVGQKRTALLPVVELVPEGGPVWPEAPVLTPARLSALGGEDWLFNVRFRRGLAEPREAAAIYAPPEDRARSRLDKLFRAGLARGADAGPVDLKLAALELRTLEDLAHDLGVRPADRRSRRSYRDALSGCAGIECALHARLPRAHWFYLPPMTLPVEQAEWEWALYDLYREIIWDAVQRSRWT